MPRTTRIRFPHPTGPALLVASGVVLGIIGVRVLRPISPASLAATATFFATAIVVSFAIQAVL